MLKKHLKIGNIHTPVQVSMKSETVPGQTRSIEEIYALFRQGVNPGDHSGNFDNFNPDDDFSQQELEDFERRGLDLHDKFIANRILNNRVKQEQMRQKEEADKAFKQSIIDEYLNSQTSPAQAD